MRTLEEIKNDVCLEYGYYTYSIAVSDFKNGRMGTKTFNCIVRDIAKEVAKEALKNAKDMMEYEYSDYEEAGDFQLILNESNIPEL